MGIALLVIVLALIYKYIIDPIKRKFTKITFQDKVSN